MTRLEANLEILKQLKKFLVKYPDQRFHQALYNLDLLKDYDTGVFDGMQRQRVCHPSYNWESVDSLERVKAAVAKLP